MTIKPGNGIRENQKRTLKGGKKQLSCFGASELGNSMTRCLAFLYATEKGYPDKVFFRSSTLSRKVNPGRHIPLQNQTGSL